MAAQQADDEHEQQHEQHGLDRNDRGHGYSPPPPGSVTASPSRQLASCAQTLSSIISVPLQFSSATDAGFWQITSRQTTSVVPTTCVLHWP